MFGRFVALLPNVGARARERERVPPTAQLDSHNRPLFFSSPPVPCAHVVARFTARSLTCTACRGHYSCRKDVPLSSCLAFLQLPPWSLSCRPVGCLYRHPVSHMYPASQHTSAQVPDRESAGLAWCDAVVFQDPSTLPHPIQWCTTRDMQGHMSCCRVTSRNEGDHTLRPLFVSSSRVPGGTAVPMYPRVPPPVAVVVYAVCQATRKSTCARRLCTVRHGRAITRYRRRRRPLVRCQSRQPKTVLPVHPKGRAQWHSYNVSNTSHTARVTGIES